MKKQYLFIDGYNLLFRMKEYELIKSSTFPAERDVLIDILKEYAGGNNYIVYCEKADQWIERKTRELRIDHFVDIIVVSDDHDERDATLGYGAILRDCHMFIKELKDRKQVVSKIAKNQNSRELKNRHIRMSDSDRKKLENFLKTGKF